MDFDLSEPSGPVDYQNLVATLRGPQNNSMQGLFAMSPQQLQGMVQRTPNIPQQYQQFMPQPQQPMRPLSPQEIQMQQQIGKL